MATFSLVLGTSIIEYTHSNASNVFLTGITEDQKDMFGLKFYQGRYFTPNEFHKGANRIIIGYDVAKTLFRTNENPIGKYIKIKGQRLQIIGVLEKEGKDLINPINFDDACLLYTSPSPRDRTRSRMPSSA